jgi:secreted PhoX family phosphatase
MLTNNSSRSETSAGNPRAENVFGHIIEVSEDSKNFSSTTATWDVLVQCGDPEKAEHNALWNPQTSENGWFASPDNAVVDSQGRLWVATDQSVNTSLSGTNDGLWAMETAGAMRGTGKMFFRAPMGAEICGPIFADDGESLFLSVQHPGDTNSGGVTRIKTATTYWPDFEPDMPPRPSVMVVQRKGGGKVG